MGKKGNRKDELQEFQRTQANQYEPWKYAGSDVHPYVASSHKPLLSAFWYFLVAAIGIGFGLAFLIIDDFAGMLYMLAPFCLLFIFLGIAYVRKFMKMKKMKEQSREQNRHKKRKQK